MHYLVNMNQSTQGDTLPATVGIDISVADVLSNKLKRNNVVPRVVLVQ